MGNSKYSTKGKMSVTAFHEENQTTTGRYVLNPPLPRRLNPQAMPLYTRLQRELGNPLEDQLDGDRLKVVKSSNGLSIMVIDIEHRFHDEHAESVQTSKEKKSDDGNDNDGLSHLLDDISTALPMLFVERQSPIRVINHAKNQVESR